MNDTYGENILKKEDIVKKIVIIFLIVIILLFITGYSTKGVNTNGTNVGQGTIRSSNQETNENSNNSFIPSCH